MKKIISLFMVILLLATVFCGCGGTESKDENPSDVGSVGGEASSDTDDEQWRELTVTFDEGRAPTALGLDVPVDTVFFSALNDIVNDIKIYFAELSEEDKAALEAEVANITNAKVSEAQGKICVSFLG